MKITLAPDNLDLRGLALSEQTLGGVEPLAGFDRLAHEVQGDGAAGLLAWQATAQLRADATGAMQVWMRLAVQVELAQVCQRCLARVDVPLAVDQWFRFVQSEDEALAQDEQAHEDVLVFSKQFNLRELISDEVLLAMPLVPLHQVCPVAVRFSVQDADFVDDQAPRENPFAMLTQLKTGPG